MSTNRTGSRSVRGASTASQVLDELTNLVPEKNPEVKKTGEWELPLTPEAQLTANRWADAKELSDPLVKRLEKERNEFNAYALRVMAEKLLKLKSKPSNPIVATKRADGKDDHKFKWLFCDSLSLDFPAVPEGVSPRDHYAKVLENSGLHPVDAAALVNNEFDFCPVIGFKSFTELLDGSFKNKEFVASSDQEKAAGLKLKDLVMWDGTSPAPQPLTAEEKDLVLERSSNAKVKAGFLSRVTNYCRSVDQIMAVFSLIQPKVYPSYLDYASSDDAATKISRKKLALTDILGV